MKLPLRTLLAALYTIIVALSLTAFGLYLYFSLKNELESNLDSSLLRVAYSLDYILKKDVYQTQQKLKEESQKKEHKDHSTLFPEQERQKFIGPLLPKELEESEKMWSAVYEHILLNPRNYFIQISDSSAHNIWKSRNLKTDSLPFPDIIPDRGINTPVGIKKLQKVTTRDGKMYFAALTKPMFSRISLNDSKIRLLTLRSQNSIISVGYTIQEMEGNLRKFFNLLIFSIPVIIIIAITSGFWLSKLSLNKVDAITKTAQEITASNLSRRLPEQKTNDEIGRLVDTLNEMIGRLEISFNQIRQFTSDVSHELRTPLTILRGELEIALHSRKSIEYYEEIIASALEESERLSSVVETLLEISRAESGQLKLNLETGNLSELVSELAEDASILAEAKNILIQSDIQPEVIFEFDSGRIHQAILNLFDNAVKYSNPGGVVMINLSKTDGRAILSVSDSGIGIPEENLPFIFDRFYRVDKSRSSHIYGTGLGLSIAKWIIEAHQGVIEVSSTIDVGTTFTIILPTTNNST